MAAQAPAYYQDVERCVDDLIARVGKKVVMAIPLALGKPNQLVNALYGRLRHDPELHLTLITAVSLEKPTGCSELERRLLEPLVERIWKDFPDFEYMLDLRNNNLPKNFELLEFYTKTACYMKTPHAQMNYLGSNYTHAIRDAIANGCNVFAQLIAKKEVDGRIVYSYGSNPDNQLSADDLAMSEKINGQKMVLIGQVHEQMPFMYGKAVVEPDAFDMVIDNPDYSFTLFGAPKTSVNATDWMIGLHAGSLVKDGGTLQVGIGSLGDAVVSGLMMRHKENNAYNEFLEVSGIRSKFGALIDKEGGTGTFEKGLHCSSEMFVDSLIELFNEGILKRKVYENLPLQKLIDAGRIDEQVTADTLAALLEIEAINPEITARDLNFLCEYGIFKEGLKLEGRQIVNGAASYGADLSDADNRARIEAECLGDRLKKGVSVYASFFIGPQKFYKALREMPEAQLKQIDMRGVDYVNQLYGNQELKTIQRRHGRFINAALKVNLAGAVTADALEDHQIISGPGGQYNFVSMAHALPDGRAITMIRSTRGAGKKLESNIVWQYGHITIPRHLRDIVITEYGIADLRGRRDKEVMAALINIADSRFQGDLLAKAKQMGKLPADYEIPAAFSNNTPAAIAEKIKPFQSQGHFAAFPFGTDFTDEEIVIGGALRALKARAAASKMKVAAGLLPTLWSKAPTTADPYLKRMALDRPSSLRERLLQKVVTYALESAGALG